MKRIIVATGLLAAFGFGSGRCNTRSSKQRGTLVFGVSTRLRRIRRPGFAGQLKGSTPITEMAAPGRRVLGDASKVR